MLISGGSDWTVRCWDVKAPGGPPSHPQRLNGALPDGALDDKDVRQETYAHPYLPSDLQRSKDTNGFSVNSIDLLQTFPTKRTSIINVQVTPRNLVLVAGTFMAKQT